MTDAMTGPGAEGAPRDGKQRGRATFPATPPGHDPATEPPTASRHGETGTGTGAAPGADTARGREQVPGADTARGGADPMGGETLAGRDSVPDSSGAQDSQAAGTWGNPAAGAQDSQAAGTRGNQAPGTRGNQAPGTRDSQAAATITTTTPDLATTRDRQGTHGGSAGTRGRGREATGAEAGGHDSRLLPRDECDKLAQQLQHAVTGFVDGPRDSVAEADHVLEEAAARFTEAVTRRRRTLRRSWQATDGGDEGKPATSTDTEQLRLALQDYRELADRLLHL
ncbi:hypothetical protein M2271_006569 [Streptomyces sp. LBL]|uniref:hypothetical protein n=1 Tax=Streptomyces sp. LBL TaxID=2940562 RepID=UPI0024751485|nr:hypothetical protein [Streptomyces sp. LBL]MDH6628736.1 hypothetical protein [Streptomyces sp. LBL]